MTQEDVDKLNETIPYAEGKVYWEWNKNWTSDLWKRLYKLGYRTKRSKAGFVYVYDEMNKPVCSDLGRARTLATLAILMY